MESRTYKITSGRNLIDSITYFFSHFNTFCILNSNSQHFITNKNSLYCNYNIVAGAGVKRSISSSLNSFNELKNFVTSSGNWIFGHLCYDLKNETEPILFSKHSDYIGFENIFFFEAEIVVLCKENILTIIASSADECNRAYNEIIPEYENTYSIKELIFNCRMDRKDYGNRFKKLKQHIQLGDIYEITFCREFFAEANIQPSEIFKALCTNLPAPFSALYKINDKYLISASPERFMLKRGNKLISQPMKGTYPRLPDAEMDLQQIIKLKNDIKERSENVMITDLVRNDLSRSASVNSVKVEELFGVYTFPNVHQMISTVVSELKDNKHFTEAIKYAFPMGSMTGAPKIRAMQLIEEYETARRGLFSGSVGYISPDGNFDFSVIIRSLLYNSSNHYLSLSAGGAITSQSDEEKEFAESELKASGILNVFKVY